MLRKSGREETNKYNNGTVWKAEDHSKDTNTKELEDQAVSYEEMSKKYYKVERRGKEKEMD